LRARELRGEHNGLQRASQQRGKLGELPILSRVDAALAGAERRLRDLDVDVGAVVQRVGAELGLHGAVHGRQHLGATQLEQRRAVGARQQPELARQPPHLVRPPTVLSQPFGRDHLARLRRAAPRQQAAPSNATRNAPFPQPRHCAGGRLARADLKSDATHDRRHVDQ
jgi:hypothetical protein